MPMIKLVGKMKVVKKVNQQCWALLSWCLSWAEKIKIKGGVPTRRKRGYHGVYILWESVIYKLLY